MYLSRVELDSSCRNTMLALSAPQKIHGAVEQAFAGGRQRRLWRIDSLNGRLWLLILSSEKPQLDNIARQFGNSEQPVCESKDYQQLLNRIQPGTSWRFRLRANPVVAKKQEGERGRVTAHCTADFQKQWLLARAEANGFALEKDNFDVSHIEWYRFRKGNSGHRVVFLAVTFDGVLQVTDAEKFRQALINGIGRGKAYGMGLLTVMQGGAAHV